MSKFRQLVRHTLEFRNAHAFVTVYSVSLSLSLSIAVDVAVAVMAMVMVKMTTTGDVVRDIIGSGTTC